MQAPANFIRLRSLSFDAAIAGVEKACEVKDGFLSIPVSDIAEAMTIIERLGDMPARTTYGDTPTTKNAFETIIDRTTTKLRAVADLVDSPPKTNGVHGGAEHVQPGLFDNTLPTPGPSTTLGAVPLPAESAPAKPKKTPAEKKPAASKKEPARTAADDVFDGEKEPRNVADDIREQTKAVADASEAEPEAPAPSKEPEEFSAPEEEAPAAPKKTTGLDEAYISSAPKVRDIVVHLYEHGFTDIPSIIGELANRKDHPLVSKAVVTAERIEKMLAAVGIDLPGVAA